MARCRTPDDSPGEAAAEDQRSAVPPSRSEEGGPGQPVQEPLIAEPAGESWTPPRAVSYPAPLAAPTPQSDLDDPDLPYWLALNRVKGIVPARFRLLLDAFGSAEAAWTESVAAWQAAGLDARTAATFDQQRRRIVPEAELERLVKLRICVVRHSDPGYPRLLREITLPPPLIYVRGALAPEDDWAVGIVGTRRATAYGRQVTERLARELAEQRITIVSGLARGIDSYAHAAALDAPGRTIAVLGCGPDLVYPPENVKLAARIVEQGAVLTESGCSPPQAAGLHPKR